MLIDVPLLNRDAILSNIRPPIAAGPPPPSIASQEYNQSRAGYKRRVGKLRHHYKNEHARHRAKDLAERDAAVAATTRRRLERQRAKNERSLQNAIRQEELRRQQARAFEDHLRLQQEIRTARNELNQKAPNAVVINNKGSRTVLRRREQQPEDQ
mmetsp:Transcript_1815/g.3395  ORF Transcript_1815/g.3395 Transcript_1815/m.3395 type:complete len:155 (-) Transcript_1815:77-541(-)